MSYKALYRTYRPATFGDVVGQDHITNTLKNIIVNDKVSHAYLFAGPRGTGKTSVAHVFANTLNCSDSIDPTTPCGDCTQCQTKNSMDIIEIDAASNNGVADIRTLIGDAVYAPSISKYKIYIIDEVHMLSKGAFNALLKTLEEPPKHVVFILATTEPHKIPVTILSRTQRFNFRRIPEDIISTQLRNVLTKENIKFDDESIRMISKLSNGGMRDALSIADQASAFSNGMISVEVISKVFGIISTQNQIKLLILAYKVQTKDVLSLATKFIDDGGDIERITISLIDILKDFIVYSKTSDVDLMTLLNVKEISNFNISTTFAYGTVDILMKLLSDLRISEVPRQAFELSLLKITELGVVNNSNVSLEKDMEDTNNFLISGSQKPMKTVSISRPKVEKKVDLLSTQEISKKSDELFTEKKLENLQKEIEATQEFEIPQQILDDQEESSIMSELEDDILSTQEISLNELKNQELNINKEISKKEVSEESIVKDSVEFKEPLEGNSIEEKPIRDVDDVLKDVDDIINDREDEPDLMARFSMDDEDDGSEEDDQEVTSELPTLEIVKPEIKFSNDEILNLLVQADRSEFARIKEVWKTMMSYATNPKYGTYANLLERSKIISVGLGFILLSSNDEIAISQINLVRKEEEFIDFLSVLLGQPMLIFAITREEFEDIKKSWVKNSKAGTLPSPVAVEKLKMKEKQKSEAEDFGTAIFGNILNKEK